MSAREEFPWPPVGSRAAYVQHEEMCDLIDRLRANQVTPEAQAVLDAAKLWRRGVQGSGIDATGWPIRQFYATEISLAKAVDALREAAGGVL